MHSGTSHQKDKNQRPHDVNSSFVVHYIAQHRTSLRTSISRKMTGALAFSRALGDMAARSCSIFVRCAHVASAGAGDAALAIFSASCDAFMEEVCSLAL